MNFSAASCVTPKDNSATKAVTVDSYILTKPTKALCPNRYMTVSTVNTASVSKESLARDLQAEAALDVKFSENIFSPVEYVTSEFGGEDYRRLIEPMAEFIPEEVTCPSSQVD